MEYWESALILVGIVFVITQVTKICRDFGPKSQHQRQQHQHATNIYTVEDDFYIIDGFGENVPDFPPPPYTETCNSYGLDFPPEYDPPPDYSCVVEVDRTITTESR
ncbi:hypothetical protein TcasGA2_TC034802 [Tribolium castaneum]|uniref:Uncharacterized protein n=1 Tax=Tribolium castaneum TaxID=7070 RepID=A0A139WEW4_TRICA|nr:hypothetical protein TcasGA2_TC034802 [Tribolium castaneum]